MAGLQGERMITTEEAVNKLTKELRSDDGFYISYHHNIAMSFKDEFKNVLPDSDIEQYVIHNIANQAATNFMNRWVGSTKKNEWLVDQNWEPIKDKIIN